MRSSRRDEVTHSRSAYAQNVSQTIEQSSFNSWEVENSRRGGVMEMNSSSFHLPEGTGKNQDAETALSNEAREKDKNTPSLPLPNNSSSKHDKAKSLRFKFQACCKWLLRPQSETQLDASIVVLAVVWYGVLFFSMGKAFLPGHPAWATLLLWASALVGAFVAHQMYLPRVLGMLVSGILLRNIPWQAIDAYPDKWGVQMRAAALATIFLRCGLELDLGTMNRFKYPAMRLAIIPGLAEALFDAGLATVLFKMDYTLGLTMGFILKAVGPGLVVPEMFRLQRQSIGTNEGIPSTVVIAASFDDVLAITGYAIFSTIAIQPDPNVADTNQNASWTIASGPVQVIFGLLGGIIAGYIIGATRIWNTPLKRFAALFGGGLLLMFFLEYFELLSGGALGALFTGLVASNLWERGAPKWASLGPSFLYSPEAERAMSVIWRWIMEPILFVTVGATLDFDEIANRTIPKSIIIVFSGLGVRVIITYFAMSGFGYGWKEKMFYAIAWTPKATVQAALSAAPLALIKEFKNESSPDYDEWIEWGNDILTTGLFAIIICGTLGIIAIHFSAPVLLEKGKGEDRTNEFESSTRRKDDSRSGTRDLVGAEAEGMRDLVADGEKKEEVEKGERLPSGFESRVKASETLEETIKDTGKPGFKARRSYSLEPLSSNQDMRQMYPQLIAGEDLDLVAEYIESIRHLTAALKSGDNTYSREDVLRLSDRVLYMQQRIEHEVGHREPSVRELFRTAASMAPDGQRPLGSGHRSVRSTGALPNVRFPWDFRQPRSSNSGYHSSEDV